MALEAIDLSLVDGNILTAFWPLMKKVFSKSTLSPKDINPELIPMQRKKALIAFVSVGPGKTSAQDAIRFHAVGDDGKSQPYLKYVWLLYSPKSAENAEEIRKNALSSYPIKCEMVELDLTNDVQNLKKIKEKIDIIAKKASLEGISHEDLAIDLTGGTVIVSLSFFLSSLLYGFNMQIMIPNETDQDGRPVFEAGSRAFGIALTNFENR